MMEEGPSRRNLRHDGFTVSIATCGRRLPFFAIFDQCVADCLFPVQFFTDL
jgi:hypothetical protein